MNEFAEVSLAKGTSDAAGHDSNAVFLEQVKKISCARVLMELVTNSCMCPSGIAGKCNV